MPYAQDEKGRVVTALTAPREQIYRCLACENPVRVRRPRADEAHFRAHFVHLAEKNCDASAESLTLLAAKRKLQVRLQNDLQTSGGIRLARPCPGIERPCNWHSVLEKTVPVKSWTEVRENVQQQEELLDVALLDGDRVVAGFQIQLDPEGASFPVPTGRIFDVDAADLLADRPIVPLGATPAKTLCESCERTQTEFQPPEQPSNPDEALTEDPAQDWSRVVQAWKALTSKRAIEELTATVERTPRERAVQLLRNLGLHYRSLKDQQMVMLLVGCQHCGEEVVFATSKPERVKALKDLLGPLVTWVPGQKRHVHVCSSCGGYHTEEWFWDAWQQNLGQKV